MRTIGAALAAAAIGLGAFSGIGAVVGGPRVTGMGGHQPKYRGPKTKTARERVPKMLRQYAKRYGKLSPDGVLSLRAQFRNVPVLDHWRDRREALRRAMGVSR